MTLNGIINSVKKDDEVEFEVYKDKGRLCAIKVRVIISLEIPNTLYVKVSKGNKDIDTVMEDIMALTKLNYNACVFGDGKPVTLSFSDNIGGILTATDNWRVETRQFKYYI